MKICGIISEYNPFHNGHIYHIKESRRLTGCDTLISVMSGNFAQRGEPAILDKFERAKLAANYVDAVVELPCAFALSPAEDFAYYGVKILDSIGADYISFGSECGNLELLQNIANYLCEENSDFKKVFNYYLKQGYSSASAKTKAVEENFSGDKEIIKIISKPNNLLAIEYLKAIKSLNSKIIPVTIKRIGDYNDENETTTDGYPSANKIRKLINENRLLDTKDFIDKNTFNLITQSLDKHGQLNQKTLSDLVCYKLKTDNNIKKINGIVEGLENRFKEFSKTTHNLEELLNQVKTKRYPYSKLKRITMNILLDINAGLAKVAKKIKPYIKILALNNTRKDILTHLSDRKCRVIARYNDYKLIKNTILKKLISIDVKSSEIYSLLFKDKIINDYNYQVIK